MQAADEVEPPLDDCLRVSELLLSKLDRLAASFPEDSISLKIAALRQQEVTDILQTLINAH